MRTNLFYQSPNFIYSVLTFQVTYSQLQLGENYRSYNNRQSHPNLRAAVAESVNGDSEADQGSTDRWATRRRRGRSFSTTKSCPVILNYSLNMSFSIAVENS